ncbi:MAG: hypothetical protein IPL28_05780 [Chloroflexi bacterium]|nr:hypothetical protein [Chloroflexota bacterium]
MAGEIGAPVQRQDAPTADIAPSALFTGHTSNPSALVEAEVQRSGGAEEMGAPVLGQDSPEVTAPPIQAGEQGGRWVRLFSGRKLQWPRPLRLPRSRSAPLAHPLQRRAIWVRQRRRLRLFSVKMTQS